MRCPHCHALIMVDNALDTRTAASLMGAATSPLKRVTARENGTKGGRPPSLVTIKWRQAQTCRSTAALQDWVRLATPAQVRRGWRAWMGQRPAWA